MADELLRLARRQRGLLLIGQCRAAGVADEEMRRRLRRGEWRTVRSGVVSTVARPDGRLAALVERALAVLLVLPEGALICGRTAAALWRVTDCPPEGEPVHVLLPPGCKPHRLVGVQLHTGEPDNGVLVGDVLCTDLARTLLDACAELPLANAVALLDGAERQEPGTLEICRMRAKRRSGRGHQRARRALLLATGRPESTLESLAWVLWNSAGLPVPLMQAVIRQAGRFIARVDFLWPEAMLIVEVDGLGKYAEGGEMQREKGRQNMLVAEGYLVLRFTWADVVHRPEAVLRQIRAALMINLQDSPPRRSLPTAKGAS